LFHVEVKQFPHVARSFNITPEELEAQIVGPWRRGEAVRLDDRGWAPERAKLKIYEGPRLRGDELGLGRGWANVTRTGEDVTDRLLAEPRAADSDLKQLIVSELARGHVALRRVPALVSEPGLRASGRLAAAEQAVWELLHEGRVGLTGPGGNVERGEWEATVLDWSSWAGDGLRLHLAQPDSSSAASAR
jgi:hypothetical protein